MLFCLVFLMEKHCQIFFFSFSSQETPPGSGNSCHYPWCFAGIGLSSLTQHDSQVTLFKAAVSTLLAHTSDERQNKREKAQTVLSLT